MAFVGEAFLSASLQVALEKLATPVLREFGSRLGVDNDLKKLTRMLSKIQAVIADAEQRQISDKAVEMWLSDLKQVAFDAEDLLDEVATEARQFNEYTQVQNFISSFIFKSGLAPKIKEIMERVQEVSDERDELSLKEGVGRTWSEIRERPQTSSLVDESCVFDRTGDVKKIVELLIDQQDDNNNISVIPIVGLGGLGKTTLAQLVYNDKKVMDHFGKSRIWVCVSDEFDVSKITRSIIEAATKSGCDLKDLDPLQTHLQDVLKERRFLLVLDDVWNEDSNHWDLLRLPFRVGANGSKIIVTTRSKKVSSVMGTVDMVYELGSLSNDGCWSLFKDRAFVDGNSDAHPNLVEIGMKIIEKCKGLPLVAKALGGLLHSKVNEEDWKMILNSGVWESKDNHGVNNIMPALLLSYDHLSPHLRQCFAFCSIFPKDHKFDKEELVRIWAAEGFVQPKKNKTLEDVGCEYFDDLLLRSFFQCYAGTNQFVMHGLMHDLAQYVSREICYTVEDNKKCDISEKARHAQFTTQGSSSIEVIKKATNLRTLWFSGTADESNLILENISAELRRLRVLYLHPSKALTELPNSIGNLNYLRYLNISRSMIKRLPESISSLHNLEILNLDHSFMLDELPNSIGNLKRLRYLNISQSRIKTLPKSISSLHNLETLHLGGCNKLDELLNSITNLDTLRYVRMSELMITRLPEWILKLHNLDPLNELDELPSSIGNLTSLRHLYLAHDSHLALMPRGIGRLTNLQTVPPFMVNKKIGGGGMEELKELSKIGGKLWIAGLEDVTNVAEAKEANLEEKHHLQELVLDWSSNSYTSDGLKEVLTGLQPHEGSSNSYANDGLKEVLTGLQPHTNIEILEIKNYQGFEFSSWVGDSSYLCLERIELINCENVDILPPLGKLPALKFLTIKGLHGLKYVGREFYGIDAAVAANVIEAFPSLESLTFSNMRELMEWGTTTTTTTIGAEDVVSDGYCYFPRLSNLYISECPKLRGLPKLASLRQLDLNGGCHEMIFASLNSLTSLSSLTLSGFQNLSSCPEDILLHGLKALERLDISGHYPLTKLKTSEIFMSLKYLNITSCPELECLLKGLQDLSSLEGLVIKSCEELKSFSADQAGLPTSLRSLKISGCSNLQTLPMGLQHLTSLEELDILNCRSLRSLPEEGLPSQLLRLAIGGSKILVERCQGGEDYPKIKHIPVSFEEDLEENDDVYAEIFKTCIKVEM